MKSHYHEIIRQNNQEELTNLKDFMKSENWNLISKDEKEHTLRRVRFLEKILEIDSKPYNGVE